MITLDSSRLPYAPVTAGELLARHDHFAAQAVTLGRLQDPTWAQVIERADLQDDALTMLRAHWLQVRA